jgi:hypothetical protein
LGKKKGKRRRIEDTDFREKIISERKRKREEVNKRKRWK